jgi:hypothetical protein
MAILMGLVRCINIPLYDGEGFCRKGEFEGSSAIELFEHPFKFAPVIFIKLFYPSGEKSYCSLGYHDKPMIRKGVWQ